MSVISGDAIATNAPSMSGGRAVAVATVGIILEWYDFAVYGFFAVTIAKVFFPAGNELTSILLTVATFGVGFIMRPVGAIVLGGYADRAGRKAGLMVTIVIMAIGTAIIGFLPTYSSIGFLAPLLLVFARLLQGFSAGGELGSSTAFMIENAPAGKRGLYGSFQQASQGGALLLGSMIGAIITSVLPAEQLESWGWRIPFLIGLLIGPIGWYVRSGIDETDAFKSREKPSNMPIRDTIAAYPREVLVGFAVTIAWTVCSYCFLVYMPTYAVRELKLPQSTSLITNSIGLAVVFLLAPVFGAWSDRVGRKLPMVIGAALIVILTYPLFLWITSSPSFWTLAIVQMIFGVLIAIYTGPAPTVLSELFPTSLRSSGLSLAYNFAVTIFGGFAPFIATWLISVTGSSLAPTFYVIAASALSLIVVASSRKISGKVTV